MQINFYKTKRAKLAEKEIGLSFYIPISHFNTPSIFETKNGDQGFILKIDGFAFEMASDEALNYHHHILNQFLISLDSSFIVQVMTHRYVQPNFLLSEFTHDFARQFVKEYEEQYKNKHLYATDIYLIILLKNYTDERLLLPKWVDRISHHKFRQLVTASRQKSTAKLQQLIYNALAMLQDFHPRLLENNLITQYSEPLSIFSLLINLEKNSMQLPTIDIAKFLPTRRISFGLDHIHWWANTKSNDQYAAILSIKNYSGYSNQMMFKDLLSIESEYINMHLFARARDTQIINALNKKIIHRLAINDPAKSQTYDLTHAKDLLASQKIGFGFHQNTLLVYASDLEHLEEKIAHISKIYRKHDLVVVRETINLENAFWSQFPGNSRFARRQALISTDNFADFCPLNNYGQGYVDQNHLGAAICLAEGINRQPFYLNFHEKSKGKHDISKGHTIIIAPSNAGKTTLMAALNLQAEKYHGRSIFFDRDRGLEIYVRAMSGTYFIIHPELSLKINPLRLTDTAENRAFLQRWLLTLLTDSHEVASGASSIAQQLVERNYALPVHMRTLASLINFINIAENKYLEKLNEFIGTGKYAYLFDHTEDELIFNSRHFGFDVGYLLDHENDRIVLSMMMYLFHRLEQLLDGTVMGIYLDEGWQLLNNSYWKERLRAYLLTFRKKNAYLVFATQTPSTVVNSSLKDELIQGVASQIFLANPNADEYSYKDAFKLNEKEYYFIKNAILGERYFLFKQGHDSAAIRLNLQQLEDYVAIFSANQKNILIMQEVIKKVGKNPLHWLPLFHQRRKQ